MGQQVAAKGVTVVDDGTIASRRGSLSIDDEGSPTNRTVLIEDGRLVGYMNVFPLYPQLRCRMPERSDSVRIRSGLTASNGPSPARPLAAPTGQQW